ncbi:MAG: SEC-C metal-binding domain-containing protein [bacterium]
MTNKPNRNDPCWCGSGKKYKNCHLCEDEAKAAQAALAKQPPPPPKRSPEQLEADARHEDTKGKRG